MYPKININLYKSFAMVYKTNNLTKASQRLFISQSAISQNIKSLEQQLNCKLFKITTRGIRPTSIADAIYEKIETSLNVIGSCEDMANNDDFVGTLNIGVQSFIFNAYLLDIIVKFMKKYPKVNVNIIDKSSTTMFDMLKKENIDFIIDIDLPLKIEDEYQLDVLEETKSILVVMNKDSRDYLDSQNIINNHFIISTKNSIAYSNLCRANQDFVDAKITSAYTTENILSLVKSGVGIGLILDVCVKNNNDIKVLRHDFDMPSTQIFICYERNNLTKIGKKFLEYIKIFHSNKCR